MFYLCLVVVCILASQCLAAGPGQNTIDGNVSTSPGPLTRWINLNKKLYEENSDRPNYGPADLKIILDEMSQIEQTEAFKFGMKPLIESGSYQIKQYGQLVNQSYNSNLLIDPDQTITDLLLQTFDFDSNDCTIEYFSQLNEIHETFKQTPIAEALLDNREQQTLHCLHRFVGLLRANCNLLGRRIRNLLNELQEKIYPNLSVLVDLSTDPNSKQYTDESNWISNEISFYLRDRQIGSDARQPGYDYKFKHLILHPCKLLIDKTQSTMTEMLKLFKLTSIKKELIESQHSTILNRYNLCHRIIYHSDFIIPRVIQYTIGSNNKRQRIEYKSAVDMLMEFLGRKDLDSSQNFPIDLNATPQMNSNEMDNESFPIYDSSLITQQLPQVEIERGELSQVSLPTNTESTQSKKDRTVVRVERCIGKTFNARYPTHWSDGSITLESSSTLIRDWPAQYNAEVRRKACETQQRYMDRLMARAAGVPEPNSRINKMHKPNTRKRKRENIVRPMIQPSTDITRSDDQPKVVRIEKAIGRGSNAKYPTVWSDGRKSEEKKNYLIANWFDAWSNRFDADPADD